MPHPPVPKTGLLQKITNFMMGFLGNAIIFGIMFRITGGGWVGAFIGTAAGLGLGLIVMKKYSARHQIRILASGMLAASLIMFLVPLVLWVMLLSMFQGIAN